MQIFLYSIFTISYVVFLHLLYVFITNQRQIISQHSKIILSLGKEIDLLAEALKIHLKEDHSKENHSDITNN